MPSLNGQVQDEVKSCDLGKGLFAVCDFAPGELILQFCGPLVPLEAVLAKGEEQGNPLQVGTHEYIDLEPPGVFVNHSCNPNAGVREHAFLVALRRITAGEEIRFDYSTTMWEGIWRMDCRCCSSRCRAVIGDFPLLPMELQTAYLRLEIVQRFIVERLAPIRPVSSGSAAETLD